jgi:hypothetical protein
MIDILKFRLRSADVEAIQFTGENQQEIEDAFTPKDAKSVFHWDVARAKPALRIWSPQGIMTATPGDWIVRTENGTFYPCECDLFAAGYERVS